MKKQKLAALLIALVLAFSIVGMGAAKTTDDTFWEMSTEGTISPTVLYDENGMKITAEELIYNRGTIELSLEFENSSDEDLSVMAGTIGYSCNAVNRLMMTDGYVNVDVKAGKKAADSCSFDIDELLLYGIREIAEVEVGFCIEDDDYNKTYTGPLKVETSLAESHKFEDDAYVEAITSNTAIKAYKYNVDKLFEDCEYDQNGVKLLSELVITNKDGDQSLFLEFENTTDNLLYIAINDIAINGLMFSYGTWNSDAVIGGHRAVITLSLDDFLDAEMKENLGIKTIGEIGFGISQRNEDGNTVCENTRITVPLADDTSYDTSGEELYNSNGMKLTLRKVYQEEGSYSNSIHFLILAENSSDVPIYVDDEYDTFSINDYMADCYFSSQIVAPGTTSLIDLEVSSYQMEDAKIETLSDIKSAEITLELTNADTYGTIDEPTITLPNK